MPRFRFPAADRRRAWRVIAVALVAAAIAASCGSTARTDTSATDAEPSPTLETTNTSASTTAITDAESEGEGEQEQPGESSDAVDESTGAPGGVDGPALGELEASRGQGSLVLAASQRLPYADELGEEWLTFQDPEPVISSCDSHPPLAAAKRTYVTAEQDGIGLLLEIHPDTATADARLEALRSDYQQCAADSFAAFGDRLAQDGLVEISIDDPDGELVEPLLPDTDGYTRSVEFQLEGNGFDRSVSLTETAYTDGRTVVLMAVQVDDDPTELTRRIHDLLDRKRVEPVPEPAIDAAVGRLRSAVLGPATPAPLYELLQAASFGTPDPPDCGEPSTALLTLKGPVWSTANRISVVIQRSWSFDDADAAQAGLERFARIDPQCVYREMVPGLAGEIEFVTSDAQMREVDGREVVVFDLSMTQTVGRVPADIDLILAVSVVGNDIVGWEHLGLRGDEPDMAALVARTADQLEEAGS